MFRVKIHQHTTLEQTPPPPLFFEFDEEPYADQNQLFLLPITAAAKGVQLLLATDGPDAPLSLEADATNIQIRQIVCTHPDIAGIVVIEMPHHEGYLSDQPND